MRYKLEKSDIGKCFNFSIEVSKRTENYYKLRNSYASTEKIIFDHLIGKMAEIAVWSFLHDSDKDCTYPDFKIGEADKGDLRAYIDDRQVNIHCKVVRHDSPVTDSWLIQKKEINSFGDDDYFALCKYYEPDEIEIVKIIAAHKIKWQNPKANLPTKSACYLSDLEINNSKNHE